MKYKLPLLALLLSASASAGNLPGITAVDVTLNLKQFTWGNWSGKAELSKCGTYRDSDGTAQVCVYGSPTKVRKVVASVIGTVNLSNQLFAYLATLPVQGGNTAAARTWVQTNAGRSKQGAVLSKTIGPAIYQLYGQPGRAPFMEIIGK